MKSIPPAVVFALVGGAAAAGQTLTGAAAYGDWRSDAPGVVRKITPEDMGAPFSSTVKAFASSVVDRPPGAAPKAPAGYHVRLLAQVKGPRLVRTAPNGDLFVAQTSSGRIAVVRPSDDPSAPASVSTFATGLEGPFGVAFYPAVNPKWVYVANTDSVVRFPYEAGDLTARGPAETIVPKLVETRTGHSTRDIVFSADGRRLFISVGSATNVAESVGEKTPEETTAFARAHALGAMWGKETGRADVLVADPDGKNLHVFATGIRNCVGMAVQPKTGDLWCAVNERDLLGDNLPPDYVTSVKEGAFYGWPWYYIGDHQDPRPFVLGKRPDLAGKVTIPDVLIQPHSAPLGMTFYTATSGAAAFPRDAQGQAFVALHGSWNRSLRTGYKVVKVQMKDGRPTGAYEDFLTGFVVDDKSVFGRPVGVATARDGALIVSDDAGDALWRVSFGGAK